MPTVNKTFAFATDTGYVEAGTAAAIAGAFDGGDGNPSGCIAFTDTAAAHSAQAETCHLSSTAETWESWGVPVKATVTALRVTAWDNKRGSVTGLSGSATARINVLNGSGGNVTSSPLISVAQSGQLSSWTTQAAGSSQAVTAANQASTTAVRIDCFYQWATTGGSPNLSCKFDNIVLEITYVDPITPTGITSGEAFGTLSAEQSLSAAGALASAEAFGTSAAQQSLAGAGVASGEAFGAPITSQTVSMAPVASGEAFGTLSAEQSIVATGLATGESMGAPVTEQTLLGVGLDSAESFGDAEAVGFMVRYETQIAVTDALKTAIAATDSPQTSEG